MTTPTWTSFRFYQYSDYFSSFKTRVNEHEDVEQRAAFLNDVDKNGHSLLQYAVMENRIGLVAWLLSEEGKAAGFKPQLGRETLLLHHACIVSVEMFRAVVDGCKEENGQRAELLNAVDKRRWTLLHLAVISGVVDVVIWLLSDEGQAAGFDRNYLFALANDKKSVLHLAIQRQSTQVFDFLLSRCNDTTERLRLFCGVAAHRWTIFHLAACSPSAKMAAFVTHILQKYPEESKLIVDLRDDTGMTALHRVVIGEMDPSMAHVLCGNKANLNCRCFSLHNNNNNNRTEFRHQNRWKRRRR